MFKVAQNGQRARFPYGKGFAVSTLLLAATFPPPAQCSGIPQSQSFGQVVVSSSSTPVIITYSFSGLSAAPSFSLTYGAEFTKQTPSCTVGSTTTCTISITFSPKSAGLRQDALIIKNQSGTLLGTTLLYGIGLAPQMALRPGIITTVAGTFGTLTLFNPEGVAVDTSGNIYIADSINQVIRKVAVSGGALSIVAGTLSAPGSSGDGGAASSANLNNPTGVALDGAGNLYIADQGNGRIREVNAVTGIITTVAGGGNGQAGTDSYGDGGPATGAVLSGPNDVAVDALGNLYIADSFHGLVREVSASTGVITIVAGGGSGGGTDGIGDGAAATNAILDNPTGVAVDSAGNVYIADSGNSIIRQVNTAGIINVVAGNGSAGYAGDLGPATAAELTNPTGVRVDAAGNIYISDLAANVIRKVNAASGMIQTVAGTGSSGYSGDSGSATAAALTNPQNLALDAAGNLYIADSSNNVVRKVTVASSALTFPSVSVGEASNAQFVTVSNIGTQTLNLSAVSLSANFAQKSSGYSDCSASSTLATGADCIAAIAFVPTTTGALSGTLTVTGNSLNVAGTSQKAALTGTGNNSAVPKAVLSPTSLAFGNQNIGIASAAKTVTLSNTGAAALNILSIWLGGTNSSDFAVATTCGSVLAAGANCTVSITFSPAAVGSRTASLMFTDSVASSPQSVSLTGTGTQPANTSFNSASVTFGNQNVGTPSAPATVTLTNTGTGALSISSIALTGTNAPDFAMTTTCGSTLAAGVSCSVTLTFSPSAAGTRSASLTFTDGAASSPQSVALTGTGIQTANTSFNPTSVTFANQNIGTSSAPATITLTNTGAGSLSIASIVLSGINAPDFAMTTTCGSTLAAGASCGVTLTFSPSAAGTRSASLSFADSAASSPQGIAITGTGTTPPPPPAPAVSFTNVPGALSQISLGADGAVWGLNAGGEIYQRNAATESWTYIPGNLAHVFVGSSTAVWGINSGGQIYRWNSNAQTWDWIRGTLVQLSVGCDGDVWGLNSAGSIYHFDTQTQGWDQIPGTLAQLAVGFDGAVWGLNAGHAVFRFNQATQTFIAAPGSLTQIAVGADGDVWGLSNQTLFHFNQLSQAWDQMAGSLTQLAVGSGGVVYGLNAANQVCQYNAQTQSCTWIGSLATISAAANGAVWGLDNSGGIWVLNQPTETAGALHPMPAAMSQLALASDGSVWALNSAGLIFQFNLPTQSWTQVDGSLAQLATGPNGIVWGLNASGQIYRFTPASQGWTAVPGNLSQLSVGGDGSVWGLNASGQIYSFNSSSQSWTWIPGTLAHLWVGIDGTVWGLNSGGQSYRFDSSTGHWNGVSGTFSQIAVGSKENVWALGSQGQVYQYNPQSAAWHAMSGTLAHIAVGFDGAVWGINSSNQVFRYDPGTAAWDQVAGSLAQIAVASDAVVWGTDGSGSVYRFQ